MGSQKSDDVHRKRRCVARSVLVVTVVCSIGWLPGCREGSSTSGAVDTTPAGEPDSAPSLRAPSNISDSVPVGPAEGSPWIGVRRDCGISAPLADGTALWFYCDTLRFTPEGELEFFLNTSVARADDDDPLVMVDQPDRRGDLRPVLDPVPGYPPCSAGQGSFTWPMAAFTEHLDERRDRVVVYFENMCVLPGQFDGHDVGVAELIYDFDEPPGPNSPIVATVIEPRLFPRADGEPPFGLAAVAHDGWVYVYRCPHHATTCEVGRARPGQVASRDAYRYWTGQGWSDQPSEARALDMPDGFEGTNPAVERVEDLDVFVMINHPIDATDSVRLRVASSPIGPWSAPADVALPACEGFYPLICFAAQVHDHLSAPGSIGLTWFDPTYPSGGESPTRFAQLPVTIDEDDGGAGP